MMHIRGLSRPVRLSLYAIGVVLTVVFMTSCVIGVVLMLDSCDTTGSHGSTFCSESARIPLELLCLAVLAVAGVPWIRFMTRALNINEVPESTRDGARPQMMAPDRVRSSPLSLGQVVVSGAVEEVNPQGHRIMVRGLTLRFWGGHALRAGWLRNGDRASFVYQRIPVLGLNYVLAFTKEGNAQVRGVGGIIHSGFWLVGIVGAITALLRKESVPWWLMPVCIALILESSVYLALLTVAKRTLRDRD
jgi:hypothetical protein